MSEQHEAEADAGTSLEEIFNSREFGRASGAAGADGVAGIADVDQVIVTKEFGLATRFAAPMLQGSAVVGLNNPPLEDVLHSSGVGPPLALVSQLPTGPPPVGVAMPAEDAAVAPLDIPRPYRYRHRAVAAVSGIAAAALVVAGVTSGTVQRRPSEVSAQGAHRSAASQGIGPSSGAGTAVPSGPTATVTLSAAVGGGAGSSVRESDSPLPPGNAPGGGVTPSGPATTSGTAVPSPTVTPSVGPAGGTGAPGSGSPPPPSAASDPVRTITTAVASTAATAGASVTTVGNQLGNSVPLTAPATSAVGAVMGGIGQTVDLTMG